MRLNQIYWPIRNELADVEQILKHSLRSTRYKSILEISNYLLDARGKRLRPVLVLLSAKASCHSSGAIRSSIIPIACAMELIHMASLIHDDVIDDAGLRHHKPTINAKWGEDVSIALGDYLYSEAFRLISECGNSDIIRCINSAAKSMCEGELFQVCERDNLNLLKERYLVIVRKKTAALFATSCQIGAIVYNRHRNLENSLKEYGLNFGIAFQIRDDCQDLIGNVEGLGKDTGADFRMGEITLPILNLLSQTKDKEKVISLLREGSQKSFKELRKRFINSESFAKTKEEAYFYIQQAKNNLSALKASCYKQSLFSLADFIIKDFDND